MREKNYVRETTFNQLSHDLLEKEVEVITLQGDFTGRLLDVGKDVIVLETRMRQRPLRVNIRIEAIVAIYRSETPIMPRSPFDFHFGETNFEGQQNESSGI